MSNEENEIDLKLILESIFRHIYVFFIVLSLSSVFFYLNWEKYNVREYTATSKISLSDINMREIIFSWNKLNKLQKILRIEVNSTYSFNMSITHVYDEYKIADFFQHTLDKKELNQYLKNYAKSNFNNTEFSSIYEFHDGIKKEFIVNIKSGNMDISKELCKEAIAHISDSYKKDVSRVVESKFQHFNERLTFFQKSMQEKMYEIKNEPTFFENKYYYYQTTNGLKSGLEVISLIKFELNETYENLKSYLKNFNLNLSNLKIDIDTFHVPLYYYLIIYLIGSFLISMFIITAIIVLSKKK